MALEFTEIGACEEDVHVPSLSLEILSHMTKDLRLGDDRLDVRKVELGHVGVVWLRAEKHHVLAGQLHFLKQLRHEARKEHGNLT